MDSFSKLTFLNKLLFLSVRSIKRLEQIVRRQRETRKVSFFIPRYKMHVASKKRINTRKFLQIVTVTVLHTMHTFIISQISVIHAPTQPYNANREVPMTGKWTHICIKHI